eukprot:TRINITY_DN2211_c0_g3_i2.p1 TRINITY_DN2211_c0_g3~~TRINITY_DN2211_c0_g3_i2.p1  ORF type:complete len:722 (-),score=118.14 TRINITY_DN2211_c0_g3_i2:181-2346(-)
MCMPPPLHFTACWMFADAGAGVSPVGKAVFGSLAKQNPLQWSQEYSSDSLWGQGGLISVLKSQGSEEVSRPVRLRLTYVSGHPKRVDEDNLVEESDFQNAAAAVQWLEKKKLCQEPAEPRSGTIRREQNDTWPPCQELVGRSRTRPPFQDQEMHETSAAPAVLSGDTVVEYMTDVEGHWEYFLRFVRTSQVLYWKGDELGAWGEGVLSLKPHGMLVFGGDATDKGPGDIRIIRTLTSLKRRYPTQVHLVLGNRDLMKLRFYAELQAVEDDDKMWKPPWDQNAKTFADYRAEMASKNLPINIEPDLIGKLKWLLHCTMGCQDTTFQTRKSELALLQNGANDQDVLDSYFDSVDPRGHDSWMLEYLELADIGVVLGDTLFVHGGVRDESIGYVPGREDRFSSVNEWVQALNTWKSSELSAFRQRPHFYEEGGVLTRGGAKLIEYGTPGAKEQTVIYYNPFKDGNPELRSEMVEKYLSESGIKRVLSGHQPHGQAPTVVRHPSTGLLVITADTSRSDCSACKLVNPADNRGIAMSIVRLKGSKVIIEGVLVDGRSHRCEIDTDPAQDQLPHALVGRQLEDGSWVKTVVAAEGGEFLHCALGRGFNVKVHDIATHSACLQLQQKFKDRDVFEVTLAGIRSTSNPSHSIEDNCKDLGYENNKIFAVGNGAFTNSVPSVHGTEEVINVGKPSKLFLEQLKRDQTAGSFGVNFSKTVKSLLVLAGVTT